MSLRTAAIALMGIVAGPFLGSSASHAASASFPGQLVQPVQYQATWTRCAEEDRYCVVPYPTIVRYGTNGRYVSLPISGGVLCGNSVFGDPYRGRGKHCEYQAIGYAAAPLVTTPRFCASEDQFCYFIGTARVVYGVGNRVTSGVFTNGVWCNNSVFGDPAYGRGKACYIAP